MKRGIDGGGGYQLPPSLQVHPQAPASDVDSGNDSSSTASSSAVAGSDGCDVGTSSESVAISHLLKIVPHLRNDKKCAKALGLLGTLIEKSLQSSNSGDFYDALVVAMADNRRVHISPFKEAYIDLFRRVLSVLPAFLPALRGDVALWVVSGYSFNSIPAPGQPGYLPEGLSSDDFNRLTPEMATLLEHLFDAEEAKAGERRSGKAAAAPISSEELLKARFVDVMKRFYDSFRSPWMTAAHTTTVLGLFEKALALPLGWWIPPNGKMQRGQLERWLSNMQARR